MFKKSDTSGDKTPKVEVKDHAAKAEVKADVPAPAHSEAVKADAPKKS